MVMGKHRPKAAHRCGREKNGGSRLENSECKSEFSRISLSNRVQIGVRIWRIGEHQRVGKQVAQISTEILKRYEKCKDIATLSGPSGLRLIKGFHNNEALSGEWQGFGLLGLG